MNVELFEQIQNIHWCLAQMYEGAQDSQQPTLDGLLPTAFKELGTASEELQVAVEALHQQAEELEASRAQVEAERLRYHNLFEFMPCAYLVTDLQGKILEANYAATTLLNIEQRFLAGSSRSSKAKYDGRKWGRGTCGVGRAITAF